MPIPAPFMRKYQNSLMCYPLRPGFPRLEDLLADTNTGKRHRTPQRCIHTCALILDWAHVYLQILQRARLVLIDQL